MSSKSDPKSLRFPPVQAREVYKSAKRDGRLKGRGYKKWGELEMDMLQYDSALRLFELSSESGGAKGLYETWAVCLWQLGRDEEAREVFKEAGDDWWSWLVRGKVRGKGEPNRQLSNNGTGSATLSLHVLL